MNKKTMLAVMTGAALLGGAAVGISAVASADTATGATSTTQAPIDHKFPGVAGKVTAVNGTTITVQGRDNTSYTVDVSSAKVEKSSGKSKPVAAAVSDIAVGDTVMIRGTVSGTSVTATDVMDGLMPMMGRGRMMKDRGVAGTVSAVNGTTITVTGKNGTSYTIDASNAKLSKITTITAGDVQVGDTLNAEGTVSGTTVTAAHIMDGSMAR